MRFRLDPLAKSGVSVIPPVTPVITGGVSSSSGGVQSVVAGTNVTVDATDPANPIVSSSGGGGGGTWGSITGTLSNQTDLETALDAKVPTTTTVNGHALSANVTVSKSDVSLGNVDNTSNTTERAAVASLTNKDLTSGTNTFPTFNQNTTGSAAKLTTARNIAGVAFDGTANISLASTNLSDTASIVLLTSTQTLSNKRNTPRVGTTASSATPTINTDNVDIYTITAQAAAITSFTTNLSGTPNNGDKLIISITDNGTSRAITWGASFESSTIVLPTATVISTRLDVAFIWNTATTKWRVVGVA